ncbi:MAG: TetR/AcrR family transcriptional regulator [Pseudomonadota bacterium]
MARKPAHAPGELRELILREATLLIEEKGLSGLSAREIAKRISYSPGTIYNAFQNLDDVILTIEARMLDRLDDRLKAVSSNKDGQSFTLNMALTYLDFTQENKNLWNLLFEHYLDKSEAPDWYQEKLDELMGNIERALTATMPGAPRSDIQRAARVLWAGVHGITSLASADKLSNVSKDAAQVLIKDLVETYEAGLASRQRQLQRTG